jgi:hypothetical protein
MRLVARQELQRAAREHDAEAERGVARILLEDGDRGLRALALQEQGEEQARRARADDQDLHRAGSSRASTPWSSSVRR